MFTIVMQCVVDKAETENTVLYIELSVSERFLPKSELIDMQLQENEQKKNCKKTKKIRNKTRNWALRRYITIGLKET